MPFHATRMLRLRVVNTWRNASSASGNRFRRVSSSARLSRALTKVGRASSAVRNALERLVDRAAVIERHAEVVLRDRVRGLGGQRATIARLRVGEAAVLMQRDAALVPELRARRVALEQLVIEPQRFGVLAHQQVHLGHRLQHEIALFPALERDLVLAKRLGVVALAAEREAEVVARELPFAAHLQLAFGGRLGFGARHALRIDREIGVRARQRGIELDRATRDRLRVLVPPHVAEHEAHQVEGVVVLGIQLDGALQLAQRFFAQAAMVEHLAERDVQQRALGIELERALQTFLRALDVAGLFLGQRELQQRAHVARVVLQQRAKLLGRLRLLAEQREGAPELPARVAIFGAQPQLFLQLRNARVVVAGVEVRDLEIALRDLHLGVELQRLHERGDRLLVQPLVVVQHTEVVVRARVRRIDPSGERPQHFAIAIGRQKGGHELIRED